MDQRRLHARGQNTVEMHVAKGSYLVFDGWTAAKQAVEALGYDYTPPVKHKKCFRDPATGFHTNDAESENGSLNKWSRRRYGKLSLDILEMDEYLIYFMPMSELTCLQS